MRELTEQEKEARNNYWRIHCKDILGYGELVGFEAGFIAGLESQQTAPELVEALRGLVQFIEPSFAHIHITREPEPMKAARAALARVEAAEEAGE
jgi:hypothetical protein